MNLFIIFAFILSTIILSIVLERIIHSPVLVGFTFFAIILIVAAVLDDTSMILFAIILAILAFLSALLYCLFIKTEWVDNNCLICTHNNTNNDNNFIENNNDANILSNETLKIVNRNGEVVARISNNAKNDFRLYGKY